MAVEWGRAHQDLSGIQAIGIDEISPSARPPLPDAGLPDRYPLQAVALGGPRSQGQDIAEVFPLVRPGTQHGAEVRLQRYVEALSESDRKKKAGQAVHVLDRFHIMAHFGKALDEVRAGETRALKEKGYEPVLSKSRWLLLKRPENLTDKQESRLADLLQYNLKSVRAYLLKEEFQFFWSYVSPYWASRFLDQWCIKTMRSKIEPMKRVARILRKHRPLLLMAYRGQGPAFQRCWEV